MGKIQRGSFVFFSIFSQLFLNSMALANSNDFSFLDDSVSLSCSNEFPNLRGLETDLEIFGVSNQQIKSYKHHGKERLPTLVIDDLVEECRIEVPGLDATVMDYIFVYENFPHGFGYGGVLQEEVWSSVGGRVLQGVLSSDHVFFIVTTIVGNDGQSGNIVVTVVENELFSAIVEMNGEEARLKVSIK